MSVGVHIAVAGGDLVDERIALKPKPRGRDVPPSSSDRSQNRSLTTDRVAPRAAFRILFPDRDHRRRLRGTAPPAANNGPDTTNMPALFYSGMALSTSVIRRVPRAKLTGRWLTPSRAVAGRQPSGVRAQGIPCADGGGELWVLDLSTDGAPASPPPVGGPAALVPTFGGDDPAASTLDSPRWSPAGDRIASQDGRGGIPADGRRGHRGCPGAGPAALRRPEVRLGARRQAHRVGRRTVGRQPRRRQCLQHRGGSQPVATGTNTASVGYADDGRSVLFANGDATEVFQRNPSRSAGWRLLSRGAGAPRPLFTGTGAYDDVAALWRGAIGFTQWSPDQRTKSIQVLAHGGGHRTRSPTRAVMPRTGMDGRHRGLHRHRRRAAVADLGQTGVVPRRAGRSRKQRRPGRSTSASTRLPGAIRSAGQTGG